MSKFEVIHQSSPKRCEICHCADMFDPETETCGRCVLLSCADESSILTDSQKVFTGSNNAPTLHISESSPSTFLAVNALLGMVSCLALLIYFQLFPSVSLFSYMLLACLLGLTPGFTMILIPDPSMERMRNENSEAGGMVLISEFLLCGISVCVSAEAYLMLFPSLGHFLTRPPSIFSMVVHAFLVCLFLGFLYEHICKLRRTITRFEVIILTFVCPSIFAPFLEYLLPQRSKDAMTTLLSIAVFAAYLLYMWFLNEKFWEKTKISAS